MGKIWKLLMALLFFYAATNANVCNIQPYSLETLIENAAYIFEGNVVGKHFFWNLDSSSILTANTIEVTQWASTALNGQIQIITKGGHIENEYQFFSNAANFEIGVKGLFFASVSNENIVSKKGSKYLSCNNVGNGFLMIEPGNDYIAIDENKNSVNEIYEKISAAKGITFTANIKKQGEITSKLKPVITSVSPLKIPADGKNVLTINGTGFGTYSSSVKLLMPNCNYSSGNVFAAVPSNFIMQWSDKIIKFRVPGYDIETGFKGVGSGVVKIQDKNGQEAVSAQKVFVTYNKNTLGTAPVDIISHSNNGEIPFYIAKNLMDDGAQPAIERAMQKWYCNTGIKFTIAGTVDLSCYKVDLKNVISYDESCSITALGFTRFSVSTCGLSKDAYLKDLDIVINKNKKWHFGEGVLPIGASDFESTILHELGHAHLQGHVLNKEDIMFPVILDKTKKLGLNEFNIKGGQTVLEDSKIQNLCANFRPVSVFKDGSCCAPASNVVANYITSSSAVISWNNLNAAKNIVRYRKIGHPTWLETSNSISRLMLSNLEACAGYELQVSDACIANAAVNFSDSYFFETTNCETCDAPKQLFSTAVTETSALINWDIVPNRKAYTALYRFGNNATWKQYEAVFPFVILFNLPKCTKIQYRVKTSCGNEDSSYSGSYAFYTLCGTGKAPPGNAEKAAVKILTNPAQAVLSLQVINWSTNSKTQYHIKDVSGKNVVKGFLFDETNTIAISRLNKGIYFIEVAGGENRVVKKFVKE